MRTLRSECTIPPDRKIKVLVICPGKEALLRENAALVKLLAGIGELETEKSLSGEKRPPGSIALTGRDFEVFVFLAEAVDMKLLGQKFSKELERDEKYIRTLKAKLANENFLRNAPAELVAEEKLKLEEALKKTSKLESYIRDMA